MDNTTAPPHSISHPRRWIALLCVASFLVAAAVAWGVFEAVPHLEDEHAQYFQARLFAAGYAGIPSYRPAISFFTPFIIDFGGLMFSKYPPGFALLLTPGMLVGQPWLINALAAALGILGTFFLARDLFDTPTGLLAAGLGVVSPMFILLSGTLLTHTTSLALLVWFAWAFFRARRPAQAHPVRYALAAGAFLGLALASRPFTAAAVGLPFACLALVDWLRAPRRMLAVILALAAGLALTAAVWPAFNWANTGSPYTNTYTLYWPYDSVGFGPQYGQHGHTLKEGIDNVRADLAAFNEMSLGWPVWWGIPALWGVVGVGLALAPRSRWELFLLLAMAALMLAHATYWTRSAGLYGPRYFAEAMPFVWIPAARGLLKLGRTRLARWAVLALLAIWISWNVGFLLPTHLAQGRNLYNISRADAKLVQVADLQNALVFVSASYWTDYARLSWLNAPNLAGGAVVFARERDVPSNLKVAEQFPGRAVYSFDRNRSPALRPCPDPCLLLGP